MPGIGWRGYLLGWNERIWAVGIAMDRAGKRQGFQRGGLASKRGRAGRASPPGAAAPLFFRLRGDLHAAFGESLDRLQ